MSVLTLGGMDDQFFLVVAIGGGCLIAILAIVTACITKVVETRSRERTRREIAAYIAEGTITPDEGERLIKAGETPDRS